MTKVRKRGNQYDGKIMYVRNPGNEVCSRYQKVVVVISASGIRNGKVD